MPELVGILLFAVLIAVSIAVHELGHLIPAKRFGVKVTEYMIGFGPAVWSRTIGETRWGVKAVPLGGYIRMIGMIPPARRAPTGRFAQLISDARRASLDEVGPGDEDRVFYKLPVHRRIVVMLGGPVMNLILAFALFAVVLVGIGAPRPTMQIAEVVPCTPVEASTQVTVLPSGNCPSTTTPAPAAAAGLRSGDTIVALNGTPADSWFDVTTWIWAHPGEQATLTVDRGGERLDVPVSVTSVERPVYDEFGNATGATTPSGFIGVRPEFTYVPQSWSSVPATMWMMTVESVKALVMLPVRLYELVTDTLIAGGDRAANGPVSVVGVSRIGGEVAAMDEPWLSKVATFLSLAASLNLFLFLFNLVPVVPLDGGHVASAGYEAVRRTWAKMRHRPDPGPVDTARLLPLTYVVAALLLAMGVVVIWADLVKPVSLG